MNAFEYIDEMMRVVEESTDGAELIRKKDAYQMLLNALSMLRMELENAEYNYQVETINGEITTFGDFTVFKKQLSDSVIIIQPIPLGDEMRQADYESLRQVMEDAHRAGQVKENIAILPPGINILRAVLAK